MNEAKFTKGEWVIEVGCSQAFVTTDNKFIHEGNVDISLGYREERIANAHLIAAAPEMYEMLDKLGEYLEVSGPTGFNLSVDIKCLLEKARGES